MQAEKDGHAGATADNGPWLLGLDQPSYMAVMTYADNRYRARFVVLPCLHSASAPLQMEFNMHMVIQADSFDRRHDTGT